MDTIALIIIFVLIAVFVSLPFIVIFYWQEKTKRQALEARIMLINKLLKQIPTEQTAKKPIKKKNAKFPLAKMLFLVIACILPLFFLLLAPSLTTGMLMILGYVFAIALIYYLAASIKARRQRKFFVKELPNSIDLIVRSLKAGRTILSSIRTVGSQVQGPVAEQFTNIVDQVELGKDFISVVNDVSKKLNIPEFSFFVIVLSVQQETGGNIIKTLSSLANMLRQRQLMQLKIKALSAEGIFSAFFMGSLPFLVGGLIMLLRPEYIMTLIDNPTGHKLLIAGFISEVFGCLTIFKMVQIDV